MSDVITAVQRIADLPVKDQTDAWIAEIASGKSFVDIGGIGMDCVNERVTFAASHGAARVAMADIRPSSFSEWVIFRVKCEKLGLKGVEEYAEIDARSRPSLARMGKFDVVHSTGILYHVQSPAEVLWNLRSISNRYVITNTVIMPPCVENEFGVVELPEHGILFPAALKPDKRQVLHAYYKSRFGWGMNRIVPDPTAGIERPKWVENDELTCWPVWYLYSPNAFRSLLHLCRLRIIREWMWENHALQVLCEVSNEPLPLLAE